MAVDWAALEAMTRAGLSSQDIQALAAKVDRDRAAAQQPTSAPTAQTPTMMSQPKAPLPNLPSNTRQIQPMPNEPGGYYNGTPVEGPRVGPGAMPQLPAMPQYQAPDMGFNADYERAYAGLDQQQGRANNDLEQMIRRLTQNRDEQQNALGKQQGKAISSLQDRMASQGILRSGINVGQQGEINEDFQGRIAQLMRNTAGQEESARRQNADFISQLMAERNRLMADQAANKSLAQRQADEAHAGALQGWESERERILSQTPQQQGFLGSTAPTGTPTGQAPTGQQPTPSSTGRYRLPWGGGYGR